MTTEQETTIDENYSPLDAPVKKRNYTTHNIEPAAFEDIPEPIFIPPTYDQSSQEEISSQEERPKSEEPKPFNESYSELSGKEKKMGAEVAAEIVLDMYAKGCGLLGKLPEISEAKIDRLMAEGEIDSNATLPTQQGDIPVKEFAREYNDSIKDAFTVDQEFIDNVRPPLLRVLQKRGIGATDEQMLMYYFGTDIMTKGIQAFALKKQANSIIDALRENTNVIRQNNSFAQQPPTRQQAAPPQQPISKDVYEPEDNIYTDDMSFVTNEVSRAEPEEDLISDMTGANGFQAEIVVPGNMPEFGDPDILQGINEVAKNGRMSPRTRTRATKTTKTTRKPRAKKS